MAVFTSPRERRLWSWTAVVMAAIYSTLGLANSLAETLDRSGLTDTLWIGGLLGMVDEAIQWILPNRVFDIRDVGFNALAAFLAVAAAAGLGWVRKRRPSGAE